MRIRQVIIVSIFAITSAVGCATRTKNLSRYVDPFIGTSADVSRSEHILGKTFPGATTPFGLTQLSPNTITGGDNGSGYGYEHKSIEGFAMTQMSGIGWYGDLGNFLVMPTNGDLNFTAGSEDGTRKGYRSSYDKSSETARPGYYSVYLSKYNIKAETTASPHGGVFRFVFPKNNNSRIQIDLARRVGGTATEEYIEIVGKNTIKGWMKCTPDGGGWGNGAGNADYTVYFYAQFSKDFTDAGFWKAEIPRDWTRKLEDVTSDRYQNFIALNSELVREKKSLQGKHLGFFSQFKTDKDEAVALHVGLSFTGMDGAEKNYRAELSNRSFDQIAKKAKVMWEDALSKIQIEAKEDSAKTIFYTAQYHTMIDPRKVSDVDGSYTGGDKKIHKESNFTKRTIFSGWDVFRSQFPLQTIVNPTLVNDMVNSFITLADENGTGFFDRWEFFNAYSGCMVGNPTVSVIADAYAKNIRNYDVEKAFQMSIKTSQTSGNGQLGYVASEKGYSISQTLENAYADWCISEFARRLGKSDVADYYLKRSSFYQNIFDSDKNWFRPRKQNGQWEPWPEKGRIQDGYGCTESNPYQQGWFVPHDIDGMVALMGGKIKVLLDLENFFDQTPRSYTWNDYYNHSNEPVQHVPFLFNRLGAPWLTQKWTRDICANAYRTGKRGLPGNEDVGQMSAWFILASTGFHPISPGETRYELTSPLYDKVTYHLDNGKTFVVCAKNNSSKNIYIKNLKLNGKPYQAFFIDHSDIMKGGILEMEMSAKPTY